jgi:hypothetical protein
MKKILLLLISLSFLLPIVVNGQDVILEPMQRWNGGYFCPDGYDLEEGYCIKITKQVITDSDAITPKKRWNGGLYCEDGYQLNSQNMCVSASEEQSIDAVNGICPKGYLKLGDKCISEIGDCPYGYKKQGYSCVQLYLPSEAYFIDNGHDWTCRYGYKKEGNKCLKMELPLYAHYSNSTGTTWTCNYGYKKTDQDTCVKVYIPDHAVVTSSDGVNWECEYGYKQEKNSCKYINVPVNAHLTSNGHGWVCDSGYNNMGTYCKKKETSWYSKWTTNYSIW